MGLGSRGFLPLTRKLPQIVVQRGSPHDLSRSVQNELDFALFCKVLGHQAKTCFSVPTPWVQLVAPGRTLMVELPKVVIQSSPPHDLTRIRQNELDLTRFLQGSRTPFKI